MGPLSFTRDSMIAARCLVRRTEFSRSKPAMTRRELRTQAKNVATENVGGEICDESRLRVFRLAKRPSRLRP
jgi:hypothetical protein